MSPWKSKPRDMYFLMRLAQENGWNALNIGRDGIRMRMGLELGRQKQKDNGTYERDYE